MKHLTLDQIDKADRRFIVDKPDRNFNPKRNYAVINEVIQDGVKLHEVMKASYRKDTEDRVDILSAYARHALGGGEKKLEEYVGRDWMKKIYGEKILEKLRVADTIRKVNLSKGNTKFKDFYLT